MKIIEFGHLSFYLLFPLGTPVFSSIFVTICQTFILKDETDPDNSNTLHHHPFISAFFFFISQMLIGILEVVSYQLQKRRRVRLPAEVTPVTVYLIKQIEPTDNYSPNDKKYYLFFFGLVWIELICIIISCYLVIKKEEILISQLLGIQMVFSGIFSYPILQYKIHRHQFVALVLFVIGVGIIAFQTISHSDLKNIIFLLSTIIMWSCQSVVAKWLMETLLFSQFKYLFIHGLIGFGLLLVILIISPYIPCNQSFCYKGFGVLENTWDTLGWIMSKDYILHAIAGIIICAIYNIFQLTTIKLFNPTHNDASEALGSMLSWIYMDYIKGNGNNSNFILPCQIVGYIIMIIASLMYNEIIIIQLCSLGFNTKKEIDKRSEEEGKLTNISMRLDDSIVIE